MITLAMYAAMHTGQESLRVRNGPVIFIAPADGKCIGLRLKNFLLTRRQPVITDYFQA
jgi:hypothetical protein